MERAMRFHTFIAFMLGLIAAASAGPSAQTRPPDAVSFSMPASLTLHEPIVAVLAIENTQNEPIQVDLGDDRTENLRVTLKQGTALPAPSLRLPTGGIVRSGEISIAPGARYQQRLILDHWFVFERPGAYDVDVRLTTPVRTASGAPVGSPAGTAASLRFEILPRSEAILRDTCARLTNTLVTAADTNDLHQAARELSAVRDPIAVGYIGQVLEATDRVDFILVRGLARVGGPEAKALAERLAGASSLERAAMARFALSTLR
jgi:hypothetical protein